jgi:signal transduction histidine kinase
MVLPADVVQANRELLQIGSAASERMRRLVDSLLDVSRLEAGEAQLRLAEVDMGRLVQAAFDREQLVWQEGRVRGQCLVPPGLEAVVCDEERIDRVVANLIDNAVKYTPAGGQVTVAVEAHDGQVAVSVTDSGPGIPPEERERIFQRFARLARDRGKRRGFGLGLAFCRLAVEAHGGRIWVEPGPGGVGSRFVFTLPV